jgi:hypothetical protein
MNKSDPTCDRQSLENDRQEQPVEGNSPIYSRSRLPLQDLYMAKRRELAKTYFDNDLRLRLLQELESSY